MKKEIIDVGGIKVPIGTHEEKKIIIGADHRGFEYKEKIKKFLLDKSYEVVDVGTNSSERCDYPEISHKIGKGVNENPYNTVGIGICGSGIGIGISASKYFLVYSARCLNLKDAESSRKHNNANFLAIGADFTTLEKTLEIIHVWLTTPFYSDLENDEAYLRRYVQTVKLEEKINLRL